MHSMRKSRTSPHKEISTVDGRNPAPPDMYNTHEHWGIYYITSRTTTPGPRPQLKRPEPLHHLSLPGKGTRSSRGPSFGKRQMVKRSKRSGKVKSRQKTLPMKGTWWCEQIQPPKRSQSSAGWWPGWRMAMGRMRPSKQLMWRSQTN